MKRLIKKSGIPIINELDQADVKQDRCPNCKHVPLRKKDGFKNCSNCGNIYKIFKGNAYVVIDRGSYNEYLSATSNNDIF